MTPFPLPRRPRRVRRPRRSATGGVSAAAALVLLAGCGAQVAEPDAKAAPSGGHYPVTVTNCGEERTFDAAPERVVTNDVGITEIMFALGLTDHMAGYVMRERHGETQDVPWKDGYGQTEWLGRERITKEIVVDAEADLVFAGWNYGFNEADGLTPATLEKLGIDSYLLSESCRNGRGKARGVMSPLDALYTDLRNLGRVFDVEERAEALVADFRQRVEDVQERAPKGADRPRVFLYDDGRDKPLTSGRFAGPHDIITKAGGDHVMKDLADSWVTVGWETVVERDPEVIVINDYGDVSAAEKKRFLMSFGPLRGVTAIREDRVVVLDYADLVESPRNPAAVETLGAYLRDLG
ncbi:ABC transporter substrate-binding protein [Streptomyces sp. TRM 70351]|uniref:ABC transporter substrate-binding protein n=1 Tax=Streptomyces sp. TRM 70351 TaxID=3116552 RepID=UPI002E7B661F|nr:ABC transporter substrate-binding protein [Streptomyces sp. TRM 70351]MEE1931416.1 ABC transporter substrate-binding protein [Streptomyces sp. TRM 70351]